VRHAALREKRQQFVIAVIRGVCGNDREVKDAAASGIPYAFRTWLQGPGACRETKKL
jgi:hypothetical protein